MKSYVQAYISSRPWAITQAMMNTIHKAIEGEGDLEAVAARHGRPLANTGERVEQRGSVAVVNVIGSIFRYANLFTEISDATSIQLLGRDFATAVDDPNVEAILLNVNSPGGEADGISEFAGHVRRAAAKKPVWAYIGGQAASGGYWIASAASRIVMYKSAMAGSIGVIATVLDESSKDARLGVRRYEIVSSQSPFKRLDPATDEGRAHLQEMVDSMAALFIEEVADFRNTTTQNVMENFGRGFYVHGSARAIQAGMADEEGTYEDTIALLNANHSRTKQFPIPAAREKTTTAAGTFDKEEEPMAEDKQPDLNEVRTQAAIAECARINAILECEEAKGREGLAKHFAFKMRMEPEEARKALAEAPASVPAEPRTDALTERMRSIANPKVGVETAPPEDSDAAEVARITSWLPAGQRRRAS